MCWVLLPPALSVAPRPISRDETSSYVGPALAPTGVPPLPPVLSAPAPPPPPATSNRAPEPVPIGWQLSTAQVCTSDAPPPPAPENGKNCNCWASPPLYH